MEVQENKIGFLEESPGVSSTMRLACMILVIGGLLENVAASIVALSMTSVSDGVLMVWGMSTTLIGAGLTGKIVQKFKE